MFAYLFFAKNREKPPDFYIFYEINRPDLRNSVIHYSKLQIFKKQTPL